MEPTIPPQNVPEATPPDSASAMPNPVDQPASPVSSGSGVAPVSSSGMPVPSSRFPIAKIIIGLIVVVALAGAAYTWFVAPKMALAGYLNRLVKAKTTVIAASSSSATKDDHFTVKLNGKDDLTTANKPKLDLTITGEISTGASASTLLSNPASGSVSAHVVVADQKLYFKIDSFSYLTQLLSVKLPNDWYKYDITSSDTGKCLTKGKDSGSFLGSQMLTKVPVKNARLAGFETVNGAFSMHYTGAIDNSKIKAAIDDANKNLSADCKLDISADDYKDVSVSYDLWRGWSKDRLKLTISDTKDKITGDAVLDTASYNQPTKIDAPSGAKDISELLKDLLGSYDEDGGSKATDVTRKTDVALLSAEVENSAADNNGTYPATSADVSKLSFTSTDPTTKKPYSIVSAKPAAVGQIQYQRSAACSPGTNLAVADPSSRIFALVTLLEDGKTFYCTDNK